MRNTDIPAEVKGGGVFGDFVNRLRRCLMRRTIIAGEGVRLTETTDGIVVSVVQPSGPTVWTRVCFDDGTQAYLPVKVAGNPRRTIGSAAHDSVTVVEEDIPDGSITLE